jgi:GDPmannose 4,6-dehydratase
VIATGVQFTVREFITRSAKQLGIALKFEGAAEHEKAIVEKIQEILKKFEIIEKTKVIN